VAEVVLSRRARADLDRILRFLWRKNRQAAQRCRARFGKVFLRLEAWPESGAPRDDLRPGLRMVVVSPYLVLYRFADRVVFVVTVIHGARDLPRLV
jgi:toxin ParE1/3/4